VTGSITGATAVAVNGGTLILSGSNTYTGPTNVNAGILNVPGSLTSSVFVNSGGTLIGNGTIGGLTAGNGGTVAPGNFGTLTVTNNVSFLPGSAYQVQVNPAGQSGLIAAGGTTTLSGGTVQALGAIAPNLTYTLLTASGGISGTFASLSTDIFQIAQLSYTPTAVLLRLQQTLPFTIAATTPNQASVATALDTLPISNVLVQDVLTQTSFAGAQQAFNALSAEIHGSVQTVILDDSRYIREAILGRLRQAPYGTVTGPMAALGTGGPMVAYADADVADAETGLAYADTRRPTFITKAPPLAAPVRTPDLTFWAQGVGAWGKFNSDGNAADVSHNLGGFFTGLDRRFGDWRAGIAGGYTNSSMTARADSANIETAHFAAYTGTSFGAWNFRSGAALAWNTIGTSRSIVFPGFAEQATAHYGAGEGQIFSELGYGMAFGNIATEPFAGLAWVHLNTNGFTEAGGVSALTDSGNKDDVGYSTLGARAATFYLLGNGMVFVPRVSAAWQHAFGTVMPVASLVFQSGSAPFGIVGIPLARDAALVEVGIDLQITAQAKVGVSYVGQLANRAQDNAVTGSFTWRF
jgi:outer membrane autotransporter protein